jgi:hypothetical protein
MEVEDEDYKLALLLQQEFESEFNNVQQPGILCQLSNQRFPAEQIYILDDCAHKFEKTTLLQFVSEGVMTQVNVKCPVCPVAISVRDMTELLPKQPSNAKGKKGGKSQWRKVKVCCVLFFTFYVHLCFWFVLLRNWLD